MFQSLIVWGIQEGRGCAEQVDRYLMQSQSTPLPFAGSFKQRIFADAFRSKANELVAGVAA